MALKSSPGAFYNLFSSWLYANKEVVRTKTEYSNNAYEFWKILF